MATRSAASPLLHINVIVRSAAWPPKQPPITHSAAWLLDQRHCRSGRSMFAAWPLDLRPRRSGRSMSSFVQRLGRLFSGLAALAYQCYISLEWPPDQRRSRFATWNRFAFLDRSAAWPLDKRPRRCFTIVRQVHLAWARGCSVLSLVQRLGRYSGLAAPRRLDSGSLLIVPAATRRRANSTASHTTGH